MVGPLAQFHQVVGAGAVSLVVQLARDALHACVVADALIGRQGARAVAVQFLGQLAEHLQKGK